MVTATPERLNIRDIAVDNEQIPASYFDPEKEMTMHQWKQMEEKLSGLMESDESGKHFPGFYMHMYFLASQVSFLPDLGSEEDTIKMINDWIAYERENGFISPLEIVNKAIPLKLVFADIVEKSTDFPSFEKCEANIKDLIDKCINLGGPPNWYGDVMELLVAAKMVYPEDMIRVIGEYEEFNSFTREVITNVNYDDLTKLKLVANFRLLSPSGATQIQLDSALFDAARKVLTTYGYMSDWREFARIAFYLKVVSAEKIEFDKNGLKILMPEKTISSESVPDLPESRSF